MAGGQVGIQVGDTIQFQMLRNKNGCLFPVSVGDVGSKDYELIAASGEVLAVDLEMVEVTYRCEKCNRTYVTSMMLYTIITP